MPHSCSAHVARFGSLHRRSLRYFIYDAIKKLRAVAAQTSTAHQSKTFYRGMKNIV
eukprot:COSAG02_NODE_50601_length_319_cov_1.163636_1_plen_55_part_01